MFLPLYPIKQKTILIRPITEDTHSVYLIKMLSARLLHYKVTLFPLYNYFVMRYLEIINIKLLIYSLISFIISCIILVWTHFPFYSMGYIYNQWV